MVYFFLSLGCYVVFILYAIITRAGQGPTPLGRFNLLHFRFHALYIVFGICYLLTRLGHIGSLDILDLFLGILLYFGLHYGLFGNFFTIAQASVSTSIISLIENNGGMLETGECMKRYANGRGFGYIKESRIGRIKHMLSWVEIRDDKYRLTPRGSKMIGVTSFFLNFWGLHQIGDDR